MRQNIYDQLPYPYLSFAQTHPNRLATVATLLGMHPPSLEHCRVLELGCAGGGNIIPLAYALPQSEFVGIDLSARQIEEGRAIVGQLGLDNVTLRNLDILDVTVEMGQFDYIIAHGIYSWVPAEVKKKILDIFRENLSPNGVAYVSYNTYPGWYMLRATREMMLYHTQGINDPAARAVEAREFIDFLVDAIAGDANPHGSFLKAYLGFYRSKIRDSQLGNHALLTHDELAEINEPVYFHEFATRAMEHGMKYLADANLQSMLVSNLPSDVGENLRRFAKDTIELEQYMDFLRNRTFRQTLLCHQDVVLSGSPKPECVYHFHIASPAIPISSEVDVKGVTIEKFRVGDAVFSTNHPVTKAAILYLSKQWPKPVHFKTLFEEAMALLSSIPGPNFEGDRDQDILLLGANILKAYAYDASLMELYLYVPQFTLEVSDRPEAAPFARFQASRGDSTVITNMRHERVKLDSVDRRLLSNLTGERNQSELLSSLADILADERSKGTLDEAFDELELSEILEKKLSRLANYALLVA